MLSIILSDITKLILPSERNANNTHIQIKEKKKKMTSQKHARRHVNSGREVPKTRTLS